MTKNALNLRDKRTKIVATLGPASDGPGIMDQMIAAGLNIVRCNMSHGSQDEHRARVEAVREAATRNHKRIGILFDLAGPKIRTGDMEHGEITLVEGSKITVTTQPVLGTSKLISVNYPLLPAEVKKGGFIMIEDGKKKLEVLSTNGTDSIVCKVITGGPIKSKRGLNIPGAYLSIPALTEKDIKDVKFAVDLRADFIALSFVRTVKDVEDLRKRLNKLGSKAMIISKIETMEAIEHIEEIIKASDAIMVARGDLAVEIGPEHVPVQQKRMIELARSTGKPVITATQMLDSMEQNPVPTRAEVSDIANAICDGTDAIMLSGETSIGKYPIESISVMSRVAQDIEPTREVMDVRFPEKLTEAMTESMINLSQILIHRAFVVLTEGGTTARLLSRFRPKERVIAICPHEEVCNRLTLLHGTTSVLHTFNSSKFEDIQQDIVDILKKRFGFKPGERVILSAGFPMATAGTTNTVMVLTI